MFSVLRRTRSCRNISVLRNTRGIRLNQSYLLSTDASKLSSGDPNAPPKATASTYESYETSPPQGIFEPEIDIYAEEEKDVEFVGRLQTLVKEQNIPFAPLFDISKHNALVHAQVEFNRGLRDLETELKMKSKGGNLNNLSPEDKQRLTDYMKRAPGLNLDPKSYVDVDAQKQAQSSLDGSTVNTMSANRLRPRRNQIPEVVKQRLSALIEEAEKRKLDDPEVRDKLRNISALEGSKQKEAVESLAILDEIYTLSQEWNRSGDGLIRGEQEIVSTQLLNPEFPMKPGASDGKDGPKLPSYFSTDIHITGRTFDFTNSGIDTNNNNTAQTVDLKDYLPNDFSTNKNTTDTKTKSSTSSSSSSSILSKDSSYLKASTSTSSSKSSQTQTQTQSMTNVVQDTNMSQSGVGAFYTRTKLKKQPRGKLHAGQLRDLLIRAELKPDTYPLDRLASLFDISILTVLEQFRQTIQNDVVSGAQIGGFTPLLYKLQITNNTNQFAKALLVMQKMGVYDQLDTYDEDFKKRITSVDANGYIMLKSNDVIIPNLPEPTLRPILNKALGIDTALTNAAKEDKLLLSQTEGGNGNDTALPDIASTDKKEITTSKPEESFQTAGETLSMMEYLADNMILLRGKTMRQLYDLGMSRTTPYDMPVSEESGEVTGRYNFSDNVRDMYLPLTREIMESEEMAKIMYGKHYRLRRVGRNKHAAAAGVDPMAKDKSLKDAQSFVDLSHEDVDDYLTTSTSNTIDTSKLDKAKTTQVKHKQTLSQKLQEQVEKAQSKVDVISEFAQLALTSAVMVKYANHHSIIQDGVNVIDDTIRSALADGGVKDLSNEDLYELQKKSEKFPLLALEALLDNVYVPHMYKLETRPDGVGTFIHGFPQKLSALPSRNSHYLGLFHPDLVMGVHKAGTGRDPCLQIIDVFEGIEPIDRNAILTGMLDDDGDSMYSDRMKSFVDEDMQYELTQNHAHNANVHVVTNLDEIEDLAEEEEDNNQNTTKVGVVEKEPAKEYQEFAMSLDIDDSKKSHMKTYYEKMKATGVDLSMGVRVAGITEKFSPSQTSTHKGEQVVTIEEPNSSLFEGQPKELFGGPLAVKVYLDALTAEEKAAAQTNQTNKQTDSKSSS